MVGNDRLTEPRAEDAKDAKDDGWWNSSENVTLGNSREPPVSRALRSRPGSGQIRGA